MKKKLCLVIALLLLAVTFAGCTRTPITAEEFEEKAGAAGFEITVLDDEIAAQYERDLELTKYDDGIWMNFTYCFTEADAKILYDSWVASEGLERASGSYSQANMSNYNYYKLTSGNGYFVAYRVEKAVLYIDAYKAYKSEVNDFLESLGW